jgi:hypothetical protein
MGTNKVMLKEGVISTGSGARRVILDYDSGLIYSYVQPDHVLGVFQPGKGWIVIEKPHYSSGGWGRPSTGDADGHHAVENAESLVRAIQGALFKLNSKVFMTQDEMDAFNREIEASNKLIKARSQND